MEKYPTHRMKQGQNLQITRWIWMNPFDDGPDHNERFRRMKTMQRWSILVFYPPNEIKCQIPLTIYRTVRVKKENHF